MAAAPEVRPPSKGIKGAIKQRLKSQMIDQVPGAMKILIVDEASTGILNVAMRMSDLMDLGVTLVENVVARRQPVRTCPAIYFLSPSEASINAMLADWEGATGNYASANVFFTTTCPDSFIRKIAGSRMRPKIGKLTDLYIDFCVPETLQFHFAMSSDIPMLFGSTANPTLPALIANRLVNVFRCMQDFPAIRVYGAGPVANQVGQALNEKIQNEIRVDASLSKGSVLLILDRSFDVVQPFFHDLTYQAVFYDLMPPKNGIVAMPAAAAAAGQKGGAKAKDHIVDEEDSTWVQSRHQHILKLNQFLLHKMEQLYEAHPMIARYEKNGQSGMDLTEVGEVMRTLPAFSAQKEKILLHMHIYEQLDKKIAAHRLDFLSPLEVKIVTGESAVNQAVSKADLLREVDAAMKDPNIAIPAKTRLLALYCAAVGNSDLDTLARSGGLSELDKKPVQNLSVLNAWTAEKRSRARKSVASTTDESDTGRYGAFLKTVLSQLLMDTLPVDAFPAIGTKVSAKAVAKTAAVSRFAAGKQKASEFQLELGGEQIPLIAPSRVFVFIAGGFTYGESRIVYETMKEFQREIIIGGTSVLRSESFLSDLNITTA